MKTLFKRRPKNIEQLQEEAFSILDNFQDPFSLFTTTHMQDSAVETLFNPVQPEEIVISQYACRVKKREPGVLTIKNKSFYYVPLIEHLKQLLFTSKIFDMLNTKPKSCPKDVFFG